MNGFLTRQSQTEPERLPVGQAPQEAGDFMEQPQLSLDIQIVRAPRKGPLLQCNVYENLKLVQNKDIGSRESLGDMPSAKCLVTLETLRPTRCMGDEAVLLRRFHGGSKREDLTID